MTFFISNPLISVTNEFVPWKQFFLFNYIFIRNIKNVNRFVAVCQKESNCIHFFFALSSAKISFYYATSFSPISCLRLNYCKLPLPTVNKPVTNWEASILWGPFRKNVKDCYYFHVCSEQKQNTESDWHKTTMKPCQWVVVHWRTNLMCFSVLFWMRVYIWRVALFS